MERIYRKFIKEVSLIYSMADKDTGMLLFGLAVLLGMGLLYWKVSTGGKTTLTEFVRDPKTNAVIQIIERAN